LIEKENPRGCVEKREVFYVFNEGKEEKSNCEGLIGGINYLDEFEFPHNTSLRMLSIC